MESYGGVIFIYIHMPNILLVKTGILSLFSPPPTEAVHRVACSVYGSCAKVNVYNAR